MNHIMCNKPVIGVLDGFGGGSSPSPAPQDIAAILRFSRFIVSESLNFSSNKISLKLTQTFSLIFLINYCEKNKL